MGFIHINETLVDIRTGEHSLEFVRATGPNRGKPKKIYCRYGTKQPRANSIKKPSASRSMVLTGKLPVVDIDTQRPYKLFISHIVAYDGKKVKH